MIQMSDFLSIHAKGFSARLRAQHNDQLAAFAESEIMTGLPFIFSSTDDHNHFQTYIAEALDMPGASADVLIVGSARTGFSLDPDNYFVPFRETSDIDVAVINKRMFDDAWDTMLAWDYRTMKNRSSPEVDWLRKRHANVFSGWHDPPYWHLRDQGGMQLSFPDMLKPLRAFSFLWFRTFRSLGRYRHHPEIPRHKVSARLYRSRKHLAMYHAYGLRVLRNKLLSGNENAV